MESKESAPAAATNAVLKVCCNDRSPLALLPPELADGLGHESCPSRDGGIHPKDGSPGRRALQMEARSDSAPLV